jgi:hypothetical protein
MARKGFLGLITLVLVVFLVIIAGVILGKAKSIPDSASAQRASIQKSAKALMVIAIVIAAVGLIKMFQPSQ